MSWLEAQWRRLGPAHILLWPVSIGFGLAGALRRWLYRAELLPTVALPVPVVVIGNISVGGTGKTPLVLWLAQFLRARRFSPAIITRGYAGSRREPHAVGADSPPHASGDEAVLLARRSQCPVWVGADRVATARALLTANPHCDIVISDDGLQHYRLDRDLEVVVIDAERRFGNGLLLPAGPLREPVSRLRHTDAMVWNRASAANVDDKIEISSAGAVPQFAMALDGATFYNLIDRRQQVSASYFRDMRLHALAGIGNPQRFFRHLRNLQLQFTEHAFPDHYAFSAADVNFADAEAILMTEKDAVKCAAFGDSRMWVLPVDAIVDDGLGDLLLNKLGKT